MRAMVNGASSKYKLEANKSKNIFSLGGLMLRITILLLNIRRNMYKKVSAEFFGGTKMEVN